MAIVSDAMSIAYHSHLTVYDHYYGDKDMACKCLEEIPRMVKLACNEYGDYPTPVAKVELLGLKQSALDKQGELRLAATMKIHTEGAKFPKYKSNFFTYCPFCGVKYQEDNDSELYYLQDSRSFNGNYMMFWGLEDKGYTSDIRKAQTYSLEDAEKRASNRETDIPRKVSDIKPLARHCFDGQDLRKIKQVNV